MNLTKFVEKYPILESVVEFWDKYYSCRESLLTKIIDFIPEESIDTEEFKKVFDEGRSYLELFKLKMYKKDLNFLAKIVKDDFGIKEKVRFDEKSLTIFDKLNLSEDKIGFVKLLVYSSIYSYIGEILSKRCNLAKWYEPVCPVCGSSAGIGFIEGDGKKSLVCSTCYTRWGHRRTVCPLCADEEQKSMRYYSADELPGWRVEVCEACGMYLKVLDLREKNEDTHLYPLLYLSSWNLDISMKDMDFRPSWFKIFYAASWISK
ncbi:formate dehydrogenase accessory protein [Thermodesulfobium narugense DSM 14796]|uniref:Formate dehydrogenase accessory protein n=1 Tax=Thermodesulfobium narugense DSM 14796 TaxID=747365 RepID=M1E526_9BACT|nr:formate dehydrogenase accessory protein FdhE [Thermodesulfobium narugense]AEE14762.1 formate dehydrogenase accessory protein [Thermodesulfobium narugense DSM 14796]